jgi:hypothetical protein
MEFECDENKTNKKKHFFSLKTLYQSVKSVNQQEYITHP